MPATAAGESLDYAYAPLACHRWALSPPLIHFSRAIGVLTVTETSTRWLAGAYFGSIHTCVKIDDWRGHKQLYRT